MRRLPPLNALRAFEAAARSASFTRAAAELHVTQGAISRHVKGLEEVLGVRLFHRHRRGLELTREGAAFLPRLSDAFDRIAEAAASLRAAQPDLKLKVLPTFAVRWLIPRLPRFQERHPDVAVRLTTSWHEVAFGREDFDAGIVHSDVLDPAYVVSPPIVAVRLVPVCSPALAAADPPLDRPAALATRTLLHVGNGEDRRAGTGREDWRRWIALHGAVGVDPEQGPLFDIADAAWRAAVSGLGVALADADSVADDLAAGRLVRLFGAPPMPGGSYHLVWPRGVVPSPALEAFRAWILAEGAAAPAERAPA